MPRRTFGQQALLAVLFLILLHAGSSQAADKKSTLTPEEQKVIDYLVGDWGKDYSVTSVDVAMEAVGVKASDETRFRIGSHIRQHPELHEVIRRWGWVTLVLTPDEKLIGRALINAERASQPVPAISDIANAAELNEDQVKRGLAMLERYEILKRDKSVGGVGYTIAPRYLRWEPRLDFLYHTVTLASGRRFNTN